MSRVPIFRFVRFENLGRMLPAIGKFHSPLVINVFTAESSSSLPLLATIIASNTN